MTSNTHNTQYPQSSLQVASLFDFMSLLVQETNEFREFSLNYGNRLQRKKAKMRSWTNVTIPELYVWFSLAMLMPHVRKHRLQDYWSKNFILTTPVYGDYMTRDRYFHILSYLHFSTNVGPQLNDRLYKMPHLDYAPSKNPGVFSTIPESGSR